MIKRLNEDAVLKFKNLSPEEKAKKGILGRLYGKVSTWASPTRNGRLYTQDLWEKLFESDLIKERFSNGGIFGELTHPDREEVDFEKVACVMPEPPVKDGDGNLIGYVDLLDTPCGRIAYQLAKYGYRFGISSRGSGDLIDGIDGEEVDPNTYNLTAYDLVEIPAVESARLQFVESLDKKKYNKSLRERLIEEVDNADFKDREIMLETLDELNIKLNETSETPCSDKEEEVVEEEAGNAGNDLVTELQEALVYISELEKDNLSLQEKLSVSNAKETALEVEVEKYKASTMRLSEGIKRSKNQINDLNEQLKERAKYLKTNRDKLEEAISMNNSLKDELKDCSKLTEQVDILKSKLAKASKEVEDANIKLEDATNQLDEAKTKIKKYHRALKESKESYLRAVAASYNLNTEEVKDALNESYTLSEVDSVCARLADRQRALNKLPISLSTAKTIKTTPIKENLARTVNVENDDDDVSSLQRFIY